MASLEPAKRSKRPPWVEFGLLGLLLIGLSLVSWQKWSSVWIERSAEFFPLEWQAAGDTETLAWEYPIYRSNDTYQWVAVADALAAGNREPLKYRHDEGPPNGRPNAWHSGLARMLATGGSLVAAVNDWPAQRGIHHLAHWLGTVLSFVGLIGGSICLYRLKGTLAAGSFALLYFFHAGIQWDFAFSRLDHEAILQLSLLFQIIGLSGVFLSVERPDLRPTRWAILAGIATAIGWWVSTTSQTAFEILLVAGILSLRFSRRVRTEDLTHLHTLAGAYRTWAISGAVTMLGLLVIDGDLFDFKTAATLQPVFILAHLGAALLCVSAYQNKGTLRSPNTVVAVLLGLCPAVILFIFGSEAHPWFDSFQRALHAWIIEFQSPLSNGMWKTGPGIQSLLLASVCLVMFSMGSQKRLDALVLIGGLLLIGLFQSRWIGFLATASTVYLCLHISKLGALRWVGLSAMLLFGGNWFWQLKQIESNPGIHFVSDMFLQVGARDLNLNLQSYQADTPAAMVAMPFAFSATSALFDKVHPLGTFYWENRDGLAIATELFASRSDQEAYETVKANQIEYLVVQADGLGRIFAQMVCDIQHASEQKAIVDASLAWRLSVGQQVPQWCEEIPFYGTFDPKRFNARIYRVRLP